MPIGGCLPTPVWRWARGPGVLWYSPRAGSTDVFGAGNRAQGASAGFIRRVKRETGAVADRSFIWIGTLGPSPMRLVLPPMPVLPPQRYASAGAPFCHCAVLPHGKAARHNSRARIPALQRFASLQANRLTRLEISRGGGMRVALRSPASPPLPLTTGRRRPARFQFATYSGSRGRRPVCREHS